MQGMLEVFHEGDAQIAPADWVDDDEEDHFGVTPEGQAPILAATASSSTEGATLTVLATLVQEHWDKGSSAPLWACSTLEELGKLDTLRRARAAEMLAAHLHSLLLLGLWPSHRLVAYVWYGLSISMLPSSALVPLLADSIEAELFSTIRSSSGQVCAARPTPTDDPLPHVAITSANAWLTWPCIPLLAAGTAPQLLAAAAEGPLYAGSRSGTTQRAARRD